MAQLAETALHAATITSVLMVGAAGIALLPWTDAEAEATVRALRRLTGLAVVAARALVQPSPSLLSYDTSPGTTP